MASAGTTTVRIRQKDFDRLHAIAESRQSSVVDVLHSAIDALDRHEFLQGLSRDYKQLRDDPERWDRYVAEREEWDALA